MVVVITFLVFCIAFAAGYLICDVNTIKRINEVKESYKKLNEKEVEEPKIYDMTAEVDFNNLNVFSVERDADGHTIIGYWKEKVVDGLLTRDTEEWHLPINDEQHLRFIEKLRKQIKETEESIEKCNKTKGE